MTDPKFLELLYKNKFEIEGKIQAIVSDKTNVTAEDEPWHYREQELKVEMYNKQRAVIHELINKYLETHK